MMHNGSSIPRRVAVFAVGIALLACAPLPAEVTPRDLYAILEDYHIPHDGAAMQAAAVEAMVQAVDPHARIIPADELRSRREPTTLAQPEDWAEGLSYLKLNGFHAASPDGAATSAMDQVAAWLDAGRNGIIIDLRSAGGTNLAAVDAMAALFVCTNAELYAIRDGRSRIMETRLAPPNARGAPAVPVMVAIDSGTRDAAELFAACIKGRHRVMLIGGPTAGGLAFREPIPTPSGADYLLLPTRRFILPGSADPATNAIQPDLEITRYRQAPIPPDNNPLRRPRSEKSQQDLALMQRVSGDAVLGSAVDILLALKAIELHVSPTNHPGAPRP